MSLETIQKHLDKKATDQATSEWGSLEDIIHDWFTAHPSGYSRLRRNEPKYYSHSVPLMRLSLVTCSSNNKMLEDGLATLAAGFLKERTQILSQLMAEELIAKAALIP